MNLAGEEQMKSQADELLEQIEEATTSTLVKAIVNGIKKHPKFKEIMKIAKEGGRKTQDSVIELKDEILKTFDKKLLDMWKKDSEMRKSPGDPMQGIENLINGQTDKLFR